MERTEADRELIEALVDVFGTDRVALLEEMRRALDDGDAAGLGRAAHTIKGALSVFGAEPSRARAERLERMGKDGIVAEARPEYEDLCRDIHRLDQDLHSLLIQLGTTDVQADR
jgi:HPt (histidine-containing phosphotransfer) domain-containing protein